VKRNIPATVALKDFDSALREGLGRSKDVCGMSISPQSNYRSVLEQEQRVSDAAFFAKAHQLLLQPETCRVVNRAEFKDEIMPATPAIQCRRVLPFEL
jgi:hypothetical protein